MAAGSGASGGSLESKLDRRFQTVSNTMDSIQGLSTWCIENKKFHSQIVRYWMKWLRKSDAAHRLNLVYLANDIIQNCKRKNAIVYRTAFAEMLPDAFLMVNSIRLQSCSKVKDCCRVCARGAGEQLTTYKGSLEEVELREKQLAAMRVDVCSSSALRKLKGRSKRFSRDFEEGSAKLQDFVKFLERESKGGSGLLEALGNADIFYEMQYQEVKIVANAYQTFANRVSHLKRKLDALKTTLPDLDDSPIPSPSADAPSPTGSESPFRGMMDHSDLDPDLDGSAMDDDAERPAPSPLSSPGGSPPPAFGAVGENDNRDVEDMELSEEEMEAGSGIIVEEQVKCPSPAINVAQPVATTNQPPSTMTTEAPPIPPTTSAVAPPPASVDLSKIGALLNSLTATSKTTGPAVESPPSPPATTPPAPLALPAGGGLGSLLSQVNLTPEGLLGALSKVQGAPPLGLKPPSLFLPPSQFLSPPPWPPQPPARPLPWCRRSTGDMDLATEPEPEPAEATSGSLESKIHSFLQGNPGFKRLQPELRSGLRGGGG
ncbi:hypothetical protein CRUP_038043 [Coryphaenoides rupestris]|nr:hypothetical protein CRUP_038043 [Coryphaenoides rupestris]